MQQITLKKITFFLFLSYSIGSLNAHNIRILPPIVHATKMITWAYTRNQFDMISAQMTMQQKNISVETLWHPDHAPYNRFLYINSTFARCISSSSHTITNAQKIDLTIEIGQKKETVSIIPNIFRAQKNNNWVDIHMLKKGDTIQTASGIAIVTDCSLRIAPSITTYNNLVEFKEKILDHPLCIMCIGSSGLLVQGVFQPL